MFRPHPEEHLHLRLHRARSVILTTDELVEIRAAQRTYEGAYMRTALGQFSFALVILKILTHEFYPIGALLAAYGVAILVVAIHRRHQGHRQFFTAESPDGHVRRKFKTSGDTVVLMTALSLAFYATLLVLTWRLVA
ncbi:hypothetical protein G6O67_001633 [Ophiocordyceps sinensis]|uniref:DUF202 domain-containing protein n=1 Tax=Ophiocordyceps sinensis TaxID=72228 RepID=A0A8H4PXW5_9HYPO|nr:hypothetical protein G6O67_001633 [Ophiocordyceps sinensis]